MKKTALFAICLAVLLSAAGCSRNNANSSSMAPSAVVPESSAMEPSAPEAAKNEFRNADDNVEMVLTLSRPKYTVNNFIDAQVSIKNIGDTPLTYVHGSGSNQVPEALNVTIGELIGVYTPQISTLDYQTYILQPGETAEFKTPFVGYTAASATVLPVPPDSPMEFFQTEDFLPHPAGKIGGMASFTYSLASVENNAETDASRTDKLASASEEAAPIDISGQESAGESAPDMIDNGIVHVLDLNFTVDLSE